MLESFFNKIRVILHYFEDKNVTHINIIDSNLQSAMRKIIVEHELGIEFSGNSILMTYFMSYIFSDQRSDGC